MAVTSLLFSYRQQNNSRPEKYIFLVRKDMDINYNTEKSTNAKTVKGENSTLVFEYTGISKGKEWVFVFLNFIG